jgi:ribonucleotide monophosphatase NagD (HAD superfamily)
MIELNGILQVADDYDCFVFDCDGVLFSENQPLGKALEVIHRLQEMGK